MLAWSIFAIVLTFATFRAFAVRRALVASLYRTRALLTGALVLIASFHGIVLAISFSGIVTIPAAGSGIPTAGPAFVLELLEAASFFAVIIVAVALTDSTIQVALDRDFFHRDTLHWKKLRPVVYVVTLIYDAAQLLSSLSTNGFNGLVYVVATTGLAIVISFAAANLLVSGRRVKDKPIRIYNLYLGIDAALFVVTLLLFGTPPPYDYLNDAPIVLAAFFSYKVATSLSPTSRIERPGRLRPARPES